MGQIMVRSTKHVTTTNNGDCKVYCIFKFFIYDPHEAAHFLFGNISLVGSIFH